MNDESSPLIDIADNQHRIPSPYSTLFVSTTRQTPQYYSDNAPKSAPSSTQSPFMLSAQDPARDSVWAPSLRVVGIDRFISNLRE